MEHGDARTIGDVLVCGSEATMEKRLRGFADAGVTDFNARIVPLGEGREEIKASAERTREFLAAVAPALRGELSASSPADADPGRSSADQSDAVTMPAEMKCHNCSAAWCAVAALLVPLMVAA